MQRDWLRAYATDCCLTTITLAELRYGIERLPEGKRTLGRHYDFLRDDFQEWILDFDERAANEFGPYVVITCGTAWMFGWNRARARAAARAFEIKRSTSRP